ncbi:MAG: helix-turn-helix domain-containing protein, partial [Dysosmobacter sp.]|nr:helix-turn-helix domain-containing protein [Dysosmobacter sp.]
MKRDPRAVLVGRNIQRFRKDAGMTQAQLAEKINVSTAFVSRMERGEKG